MALTTTITAATGSGDNPDLLASARGVETRWPESRRRRLLAAVWLEGYGDRAISPGFAQISQASEAPTAAGLDLILSLTTRRVF